jgi:DNA-directed RNA polymerase subunit RPC12/RpoP
MALEFMGSTPTSVQEYLCSECHAEFEVRFTTDEGKEILELDPQFCPLCGEA